MPAPEASRDPFPRARNGALATARLILLTALAYYATGRLGLMLAVPPGYATAIWPPAGIALAAAIVGGARVWPGIALGSCLVNLQGHLDLTSPAALAASLAVPLAIGLAAALQAVVGAALARRARAFPFGPTTAASVARLFALGGVVACLVNATLANALLIAVGAIGWAEAPRDWAIWWGGDVVGVCVVAPILLGFAGARAGQRWRRVAPIAAASLVSAGVTITLVFADLRVIQRTQAADFASLSRELGGRIDAAVVLGRHAVEGLAGVFESPNARDLEDFGGVANKIAAFGLGIQALEWIPRVEADARAGFEADMARQWGRPFTIFERRDGKPVPVAPRPDYYPVAFVTPLKGNEGAVGFDLASNPTRNASLVRAAASGDAVATPGVRLVQNNAMGILLFAPVFAKGAAAGGADAHPAGLKGFALGVFSVPDLLGVALGGSDTSTLRYWLLDETDPAAPMILAANTEAEPADYELASNSVFGVSTRLGERIPIRVADRRWTFQLAPTAAFVAKHGDRGPYYLLVAGLLLTALIGGLILVVTDRQHQLVDSRERDLENQKFALDQHAIVSITDQNGVITYANDRFCQVSGRSRETLIGANHNIVSSGRHDREFYQRLWSTLLGGRVWHGEICNRNASGEFYWLDSTLVPLADRDGAVRRFIGICTDITARKRLEHQLEGSRAFLQSVTDSMGEGVYTLDAEGRCTFLNAEAERLLGWRFAEIGDRSLHDLVHFQDVSGAAIHACDCAIMRAVRAGRKYESEDQYFTHRDGRVFPVAVTAVPLEDNGEYVGAVTVFQDITDRRRVHDELKRSEQRLSIALSASSTGLWDYNPVTNRAVYSQTWYRMLGYQPVAGEASGDTFFSLLHPDDKAAYDSSMEQHLRDETTAVEAEFRMRRADGGWAWIRSVGKIIERGPDGRPARLIGVHIDTSAAHQIQNELASAKDAAVRANQAKSDFLATMSHEIRTPMNAIIGLSHLMGRTELTARQFDYLDKIQKASRALLAIINDVLDFSKIEAGKMKIESVEFSLDDVIDDAAAMIAPKLAEKGLELSIAVAPELPRRFIGDPLRLSQVLMNLLGNAAKFTAAGTIAIAASGRADEQGRLRLEVSVTDTGIGMSPEQMAGLFRPFTQADATTSRRFGGTGLGLAICRKILRLMGGDIEVRAVEGVGSTFTFHAPLRVAETGARARRDAAAFVGARQAPRADDVLRPDVKVLLVEDNLINQQVATELLEALGVETTVAGSGEEALEILATRQFDLVLMDIQMPGKDGLETTVAIRGELGLTLPIVAMTASAMAGDRERCLEAGMNDHIGKPIDPDALAAILSRWLERESHRSAPASVAAPRPSLRALAPFGVDVEAALDNLNGDASLLLRLLKTIVADSRAWADHARAAIAAGDWRAVNAAGHKWKGAAATLGAEVVARVAGEIEALAAAGAGTPSSDRLGERVDALVEALEALARGVAEADEAESATAAVASPPPPAADVLPAVDALARLLRAGDPDAESASERLARLLARTGARDRAAAIATAASRYDFDGAEAALAELRVEIGGWS